jgi:hypothetical protein
MGMEKNVRTSLNHGGFYAFRFGYYSDVYRNADAE